MHQRATEQVHYTDYQHRVPHKPKEVSTTAQLRPQPTESITLQQLLLMRQQQREQRETPRVQKPYQRRRHTFLSEKCPSNAILKPPKPLSTRSYLFSVRPQLSHCACSIYFGRQNCQILFFSVLPVQILKGIQGSRQTIQLASRPVELLMTV